MDGRGGHGQGGQAQNAGLYFPPNYYPQQPQHPPAAQPAFTISPALGVGLSLAIIGLVVTAASGWFTRANEQLYDTPGKISELQSGLKAVQDKQTATDVQIGQLRDAVNNSNIKQAEAAAKLDGLVQSQQQTANFLAQQQQNVTRALQELRGSVDRAQGKTSQTMDPAEGLLSPNYRPQSLPFGQPRRSMEGA